MMGSAAASSGVIFARLMGGGGVCFCHAIFGGPEAVAGACAEFPPAAIALPAEMHS